MREEPTGRGVNPCSGHVKVVCVCVEEVVVAWRGVGSLPKIPPGKGVSDDGRGSDDGILLSAVDLNGAAP